MGPLLLHHCIVLLGERPVCMPCMQYKAALKTVAITIWLSVSVHLHCGCQAVASHLTLLYMHQPVPLTVAQH